MSHEGIYALIMIDPEAKRLITAAELADRFAVSTWTIYQDMRALENVRVPILTHEGKYANSLVKGNKYPGA